MTRIVPLLVALALVCGPVPARESPWLRPPYPDLLREAAEPPADDSCEKIEPPPIQGPAVGSIRWRDGDFVRYRVREEVAVPGTRPGISPNGKSKVQPDEMALLPAVGIVTLRVLPAPQAGGGSWLEARLERQGFWAVLPPVDVEAKQRPNRWIAHPRSAAVRLLVDGPELREVRRYRISIDGGPWIEFRRPDGAALLPNNDFWDLFVRPLASVPDAAPGAAGKETAGRLMEDRGRRLLAHAAVPVTGILGGKAVDPLRRRHWELADCGHDPGVAAAVAEAEHGVVLDPDLVIGTLTPRTVSKWDPERFTADLGGFDVERIPQLIAGGVNWFEPDWHIWCKDVEERSRIAARFREAMAAAAAFWGQPLAWEIDEFDRLRSNFLGGCGFLDEPMSYFAPRGKKDGGEKFSAAALLERYQSHVRGYSRSVPWGCDAWKRTIYSANYPASVAAYDAEAVPLAGFLLEVFGKTQLQPVHALNRRGAGLDETQTNAVALDAAFMRGASTAHGIPWGACLYQGTWIGAREEFVRKLHAEGARLFLLWSFHDDAPLSDDELLALAAALRARQGADPGVPAAAIALVLPRGVHLPAGLYLPEGPNAMDEEFGPWKDPQAESETEGVLRAFAAAVGDLLRRGERFDVLVEGPQTDRALPGYRRVRRFGSAEPTGK